MTRRTASPPLHAALIERIALVLESEGLPRIAGRIFAYLLLSATARSLSEMAAALRASKASISTGTRLLERRGMVERVGQPGDRRVFYEVVDELPIRTLEIRLERMRRFRRLMRDVRHELGAAERVVVRRLRELDAAYEHALAAIEGSIRTWHRRARLNGHAPARRALTR